MKVYHGSLEVVEHPMILQPNRKLDYGEGFYTTTSEKQAKPLRNKPRNGWKDVCLKSSPNVVM